MIKKVAFTISEPVAAIGFLNEFKGSLSKLPPILDDIKLLTITPEEWTLAEKIETPLPDGGVQWNWKDEKVGEKEIDMNEETAQFLRDFIDAKDEKAEFTLRDKAVVSLRTKLV